MTEPNDTDDLEPNWTTASEHAGEVLDALGVDDDRVREHALELAARHDGEMGGRAPSSVAAAAVYTACNDHEIRFTQAEVGEAAGLSPTTVGLTFRALRDSSDQNLGEWCR